MVYIVLICDVITFAHELIRTEIPTQRLIHDIAEQGRNHWAELHSKCNPSPEWSDDWLSRIPGYGCSCRSDFAEIVKANPPDYDDFFVWSVKVHNTVNAKLGKPTFFMV